jgi:hypothetical protein
MPRDETHINVFAPSVHQFVRFMSMLDPAWKPIRLHATCPRRAHGFGKQDDGRYSIFYGRRLARPSMGVKKWAREKSRARKGMKDLIRQRDVDGNTALHFLAGYRTVNMSAVEMLRAADEEEDETRARAALGRRRRTAGGSRRACYGCASFLPRARGRGAVTGNRKVRWNPTSLAIELTFCTRLFFITVTYSGDQQVMLNLIYAFTLYTSPSNRFEQSSASCGFHVFSCAIVIPKFCSISAQLWLREFPIGTRSRVIKR